MTTEAPKAVIKGVFMRSYRCYGNLLFYETDINVFTNDWGVFLYHDCSMKAGIHMKAVFWLGIMFLRESFQGLSSCSYCQANRCEEKHKFNASVKIRNENINCMAL